MAILDIVVIAKNNIAQDCSSNCYEGSYNSASNYNLSEDAGATGGLKDKISTSVTFVDDDGSPPDFHLASNDTNAKNAGTDLSADA